MRFRPSGLFVIQICCNCRRDCECSHAKSTPRYTEPCCVICNCVFLIVQSEPWYAGPLTQSELGPRDLFWRTVLPHNSTQPSATPRAWPRGRRLGNHTTVFSTPSRWRHIKTLFHPQAAPEPTSNGGRFTLDVHGPFSHANGASPSAADPIWVWKRSDAA